MEFLKILLFCIVSAILYGILHDQITARICVEYFTIGHPRIFDIADPTYLGLIWGVLATWWAGAFLGLLIASAARLGDWPKRTLRSIVKPVLLLLCLMGVAATAAGIVGYIGAKNGSFHIPQQWATAVPPEKHIPFITDLWAHNAGYAVGFLGGLALEHSPAAGATQGKSGKLEV